jgi:monoamine oxidase
MARTKLFKHVQRALRVANFAAQKKMSDSHVREMIEAAQYDASRRHFLKYAAGAAATMAVAPSLRRFGNAYAQNVDPVLIIGAGAAGLASAYHLKNNGIPFRIVEWNKRAGGRIITTRDFNTDGMFIERGGELIDTNHYTMRGLARDLGLEVETFPKDQPGIIGEIFNFEGKVYKDADLVLGIKEFAERVKAANDEMYGGTDLDITAKNVGKLPQAAVDLDNLSIRAFLEKNADSMPSWVRAALDVAFTCENGLEAVLQSAVNLIDVLDTDLEDGFEMFGASDEAMRIKGGNENLIHALKAKLDLVEGRNLMFGARLTKLSRNADGSIKCVFSTEGGKSATVNAHQVICAIPFTTLREVEGIETLGLPAPKLSCSRDLGYGTNSKMMLGFETAFWRDAKRVANPCDGSIYTEGPS